MITYILTYFPFRHMWHCIVPQVAGGKPGPAPARAVQGVHGLLPAAARRLDQQDGRHHGKLMLKRERGEGEVGGGENVGMHRTLYVLGGVGGGTCEHALRTDLFIHSLHDKCLLLFFKWQKIFMRLCNKLVRLKFLINEIKPTRPPHPPPPPLSPSAISVKRTYF